MGSLNLTNAIFHDVNQAIDYLEELRWGRCRYCPNCAEVGSSARVASKNHRYGLYYCNGCKKTFTVTVGTLFQSSKVPLNKWLLLIYLMATAKKGRPALELHRQLGLTYNTAWAMGHKVRSAMRPTEQELSKKLGGPARPVEVDETYWGTQFKKMPGARGWGHKMKIVSLVERGNNGRKWSFHVSDTKAKTIIPLLVEHIDPRTRIMTDESSIYNRVKEHFRSHKTVVHSQWQFADGEVSTNTVEGSFSLVKRKLRGTHHQVSKEHMQNYLYEMDYQWNNRGLSYAEIFHKTVSRMCEVRS